MQLERIRVLWLRLCRSSARGKEIFFRRMWMIVHEKCFFQVPQSLTHSLRLTKYNEAANYNDFDHTGGEFVE